SVIRRTWSHRSRSLLRLCDGSKRGLPVPLSGVSRCCFTRLTSWKVHWEDDRNGNGQCRTVYFCRMVVDRNGGWLEAFLFPTPLTCMMGEMGDHTQIH